MKDRKRDFFGKLKIGNNSGFTLIELLIAALILVVAIIPMLNSFVVNARVNRKAKAKLRSTMIAQDIMEGIKGYTTNDIYRQFSGLEDFRLIDNDGIVDSSTNKVISANVVCSASENGLTALYEMKNLEYQGLKYDAKLNIDGTLYTEEGQDNAEAAGTGEKKYNMSGNSSEDNRIAPNTKPLADISVMDSSYDGIFMSDNESSRDEFLSKLIDDAGALGDTVNRKFEISLSKNGLTSAGAQKEIVLVTVTYESVSSGSIISSHTRNYTAYNNVDIADSGCNIRNLYFFYYPAYTGTYSVKGVNTHITYHDSIEFKNEDEIPITLYILKQKTTDPALISVLYEKEMLYDPDVYIIEKGTTSLGAKKTQVCTNLTTSLYDGSDFVTCNAKFYYGPGKVPVVDIRQLLENKILAEKSINRFFDAKVEVYESGAADEGYPESKLLTVLDSTKIN